jgi:uncharacterized membrane-anchored protein YitT (DUF2179 family)
MIKPTIQRFGQRVVKSRPLRTYGLMTIGALITAFGLDAFLIPNKLAAGGVSGLATIVHYQALSHWGVLIPVGTMMLVFNIGLLAIAGWRRGWRYAARSVYGTVALSLFIDAIALAWPTMNLAPHDALLAALYGGVIVGLGLGLVFKAGGNTGGTDIVAQLLVRRTGLGVGQLILFADGFVTILAAITFGPTLALYGLVAIFIQGFVIDLVQEGLSVEKAAYIMSEEYERIGAAILTDMGRGATLLHGVGMYTGAERPVILTVISRREIDALKAIVKTVDPTAFVIVSDVREVLGEGFKSFEG